MNNFIDKYGEWALVTGASTGMGAEYAAQLAQKGLNLILVARGEDRLTAISNSLKSQHQMKTMVVAADLSTNDGVAKVIASTKDLAVGLLVNNAGVEDSGRFLSNDVSVAAAAVDLNCKAPLLLTHHFANQMAKRKKGGVIFMSSIVAMQGVPLIANYAATKAYDLVLAESLAAELKPLGIDVLAAAPGFTKTNLAENFNFSGLPFSPMQPEFVVKSVLKKLGRKRLTVPGFINKFLFVSGKYLQPRWLNTASFGLVFKAVLRDKVARIKS